jgi:GGDEF domain-containing protein
LGVYEKTGAAALGNHVRVFASSGSIPERLVLASFAAYLSVFGLLLSFGQPGLGIGQGFYLPISLVALATGAAWGAAAGVGALVLYEAGLLIPGHAAWNTVLAPPTGIRLASYAVAGITVGYFARRGRGMLAASLHLLDDLLGLAKRDPLTAAFTSRGFESAINRRLATTAPFALLVGEPCERAPRSLRRSHLYRDDRVRELSRLIGGHAGETDELAHLGEITFAVLTSASTPTQARADSVALENHMHTTGHRMSFGWAVRPADGTDLLALHRAALERLHARQIVRGDWVPTATTSGLVEQFDPARRKRRARRLTSRP